MTATFARLPSRTVSRAGNITGISRRSTTSPSTRTAFSPILRFASRRSPPVPTPPAASAAEPASFPAPPPPRRHRHLFQSSLSPRWNILAQFSSALSAAATPWNPATMVRAKRFFTSIGCARPRHLRFHRVDFRPYADPSQQKYFHISSSEMLISLPYISPAGSLIPIAFPSDFLIFCTPSRPSKISVINTICGLCP